MERRRKPNSPPERRDDRDRLEEELAARPEEDLDDEDLDERLDLVARSRGSTRTSSSRLRLPLPSNEGSILFPDFDLPAILLNVRLLSHLNRFDPMNFKCGDLTGR
jgi:hypothetical protein